MTYSKEERERAARQVSGGDEDHCTERFRAHPRMGSQIAIDLQCDLNRACELLKRAQSMIQQDPVMGLHWIDEVAEFLFHIGQEG